MGELKPRGGAIPTGGSNNDRLSAEQKAKVENYLRKQTNGEELTEADRDEIFRMIESVASPEELKKIERQSKQLEKLVNFYEANDEVGLIKAILEIEDADDLMAILVSGIAAISIVHNKGKR